MLNDLVLKNRSYRRYDGSYKISENELKSLVDLARNTPSTANLQALKYLLVFEEDEKQKVFETLSWAGRLKDWQGPNENERPGGYIIILTDTTIGKNMDIDVGIVAQTMLLGAVEMGLGGCMLGAIKREKISEIFNIDTERYIINLCVAIGKPAENVQLVPVKDDGDIAYYRDENMVHYVPKRSIEDIIFNGKRKV